MRVKSFLTRECVLYEHGFQNLVTLLFLRLTSFREFKMFIQNFTFLKAAPFTAPVFIRSLHFTVQHSNGLLFITTSNESVS